MGANRPAESIDACQLSVLLSLFAVFASILAMAYSAVITPDPHKCIPLYGGSRYADPCSPEQAVLAHT